MYLINTVEKLERLYKLSLGLLGRKGTSITVRDVDVEGELVQEVTIAGAEIYFRANKVQGLNIRFEDCTIKMDDLSFFKDCTLRFQKCTVKGVVLMDCGSAFIKSEVTDSSVWGGDSLIGLGNSFDNSAIRAKVLRGAGQEILAFHKGESNSLGVGGHIEIRRATATISNFGTYNGEVYYFEEPDMVIAGCWQGKLDEFKEKAQERGVSKNKYEAVYNYFKSFREGN